MDLLTRDEFKALLADTRAPCVSIFMPTHRGGREADPIRWRVHVGEAEKQLVASGLRAPEAKNLLQPARQLLEDTVFWKHQCDGLAFFLAPQFLRLYRLPASFAELVVVGKRFHIKPLLPLLSGDGRFYILALSQNGVRLLQGTHYSVSEVDLRGVPRNLAEAMRAHDTDEPLTFHSRPVGALGSWGAIYSGHGVGIDDQKDDLLRYFQQIDRGLHTVLRDEQVPLILAAVDYFLPIYRQANTYSHLLDEGIKGNPDYLSIKELHDKAWAVARSYFREGQSKAMALYAQLAGTGRTTADLEQIVRSADRGEIEVLFLASGRERWGAFDATAGTVAVHDQAEPGDEDLLNLAAVHTLAHGGTIHAVDDKAVPGGGRAAAIYWLPLSKRRK